MILHTRRWGPEKPESVVCVHGVAQHGGIYEDLGARLAEQGHSVVSVDLRGHGESGREPPWNTDVHVGDLLETADSLGIERATWIGHSFGGRLVAAVAASAPQRTRAIALLDPGLEAPPALILQSAEIERLDWSFATVEGAVNALLSKSGSVAAPRDVITAYVQGDVSKGPDGRFRFRFSPAAAVVAWNEVARPAPVIAPVPTLLLLTEASGGQASPLNSRYREALGDLLTDTVVPNGHNVLWEAPAETIGAIERFLAGAAA